MRRKVTDAGQETALLFKTRLGWAGMTVTRQGIATIVLPKKSRKSAKRELPGSPQNAKLSLSRTAVKLLQRYFSGEQVRFDLPLDLRNATPFQRAVWHACAKIPAGETRSYAWIAKRIKKPLAARAVGGALGANPVPVIIPCHRVITSAGALGGFSGGLRMKKKLLELETAEDKSITAKAQRARRNA